jgi:hypothetical protein
MKDTCSQCGGEVEIIKDGKVAYRCRCGVVGEWFMGEEEDLPFDIIDAVKIELREVAERLERLKTVMATLDTLRLSDDLDPAALKGVNNANRWLAHVEGQLRRYYGKRRMGFSLDWIRPLELIDADKAIKAAVAEGDDPAELDRLKGLLK